MSSHLARRIAALIALLPATFLVAQSDPAPAALRFAHVFGDHCVLQRDKPLRLWGFGPADADVTVTVAQGAQTAVSRTARSDARGAWLVELEPLAASFEPRQIVATSGGARAELNDVLIGEVWLTSGQSNMRWAVSADTEWGMEQACADYPAVRYASLVEFRPQPLPDLPGRLRWSPLTTANDQLSRTSAVSYYFAVRLHRYLHVPVGIVCNAVGGTLSEAWTSRATLEASPVLREFVADHDARMLDWPNERARRLAQYEKSVAAAEAAGKPAPRKPRLDPPDRERNQPAGCYNAAIAPIGRLALRGALFLQGENNAIGRWNAYRTCFPAMIADWRRAFGAPDLPFGILSLQAFGPHGVDLEPEAVTVPPGLFWFAAIRDVHLATFRSIPHTGLIAAHDVGDTVNIHPAQKRDVGQRAARWALAEVYGAPVLHTGPVYRDMQIAGERVRLFFDMDPRSAQVVKRKDDKLIWWLDYPISRSGKDYRGFVIAGEDRVFRPAKVRRAKEPGCLEVWNDDIAQPVAVRYGWAGCPDGNAIGHDHLPVPPFRTDDWPLVADRPFADAARKAWDAENKRLRALAARRAQARELGEASALVDRIGRELGGRVDAAERAALERDARQARELLDALRARLESSGK